VYGANTRLSLTRGVRKLDHRETWTVVEVAVQSSRTKCHNGMDILVRSEEFA